MENKEIIEEIHGMIIGINEYPTNECNPIKRRLGITIQPDDPNRKPFSESHEDRDYSQFQIGQRVVYVTYTWMRPATMEDRRCYYRYHIPCPKEIPDVDYITYDEAFYEEQRQSIHVKHK